ncbi:OsmC family peroxiredoxin [Flavobacterium aquidurense]|uniref:OsmC family peroxiredoxin n=1 Tax=Flavobacterium aquidurense TaxID=362413 RepID=UPI0037103C84
MKAKTTSIWHGNFKDGKGSIVAEHSALHSIVYKPNKKADEKTATNPDELLGAAHSSCYNMTLNYYLTEAGYSIDFLETSVVITDKNKVITNIDLMVTGKVHDITNDLFKQFAEKAKAGCPVGNLLKIEASLTASLQQ